MSIYNLFVYLNLLLYVLLHINISILILIIYNLLEDSEAFVKRYLSSKGMSNKKLLCIMHFYKVNTSSDVYINISKVNHNLRINIFYEVYNNLISNRSFFVYFFN